MDGVGTYKLVSTEIDLTGGETPKWVLQPELCVQAEISLSTLLLTVRRRTVSNGSARQ